jgi:hypothetical protein
VGISPPRAGHCGGRLVDRFSTMERAVLVFTAPPFSLPPLRRCVYIVIATIVLGDPPSRGAVRSRSGLKCMAVVAGWAGYSVKSGGE